MEWLKKHSDAVMVIATIISSMLWMNGKFNDVDHRFNDIEIRFKEVEKEMAIIKTVLIMKNIMPVELAKAEKQEN